MVRHTQIVEFQSIEVKGGLIPSSLLEDIAKLRRSKELYLEANDYNLPKNERLRDRIDAAWILTKKLWEEYQNMKSRSLSLAGLHFSQRFLKEVLCWSDIQGTRGLELTDSKYSITHLAFKSSVQLILKGLDPLQLDQGTTEFGDNGRRRSPHSCLQECLNADDNANWGILFCGNQLRLLHDNLSLVKPAYLSIDLELLIKGERIDEFSVLWLLLHTSRFVQDQEGYSILDKWKKDHEKSGERVRGALRLGVKNALILLGNGFLNHPSNDLLREALIESKTLTIQEFHEQILQLVYRFLFLFTTEDRDLLFPKSILSNDPRRQIYNEGYSINRLRDLAIKRIAYEGNYEDLWYLQKLVFQQLNIGDSPLGLPGLGGLFSIEQCKSLVSSSILNSDLLSAIREIGWFCSKGSGVLTRVRYRDLNTEELGGIYEGLLELHPQLKREGNKWSLIYGDVAGSDRKLTGGYYTHDSLVQELIKSTLVPVIHDRLSESSNPFLSEKILLNIKVLDPACGSGHFLLAAARQLAIVLAQIRAGDAYPSEEDRQHALRDVVGNCIYAVDKNPMAVELCKVALWIEAIDPGKPLSFLDAHIQCGDALVGIYDSSELESLIPDTTYKSLTGDNSKVCNSLKRENAGICKTLKKKNREKGMQTSLNLSVAEPINNKQKTLQLIEEMPERNLLEVSLKKEAYKSWLSKGGKDSQSLAADLYTSICFLPKDNETRDEIPTSEHLMRVIDGTPIPQKMFDAIETVSRSSRFFHWYIRFGEVINNGGFDCLLGNPPWERIKLQEKEFFAGRSEEITNAPNKAKRDRLIKALGEADANDVERHLLRQFNLAKRYSESLCQFIRSSQRYKLTAKGDLNFYPLFAEQFLNLLKPSGCAGIVVPTGIATDDSTKYFFESILSGGKLASLFDFENREALFTDVHRSYKFSLLTLQNGRKNTDFVFFATNTNHLSDQRRHFTLTASDISLINPNTKTCPVFRSKMDAELTKKIYRRVPVLIEEGSGEVGNPWKIKFMAMFHMANDSNLFFSDYSTDRLPLYEAKLTHHYDHLWATYDAKVIKEVTLNDKQDLEFKISPRYWVEKKEVQERLQSIGWDKKWLMGWRDITNTTNERSVISSVIPIAACSDTFLLMFPKISNKSICCGLLADQTSLVHDYILRQKIGGTHLKYHYKKQGTYLPPSTYDKNAIDFIRPRVLELTYTNQDLKYWAEELGFYGQPFTFNPERRALLRAELDAFYAHLYGLNREDLRYILDPSDVMGPDYPSETFRVLQKNEIRQFGEYRTKKLVLTKWNELFGEQ